MVWSHLIGQELLKKQIENLLASSQVPHAQLFTGSPGYGVLPLAVEFSLKLLENTNGQNYLNGLGDKSKQPDLHIVCPVIKKGSEKVAYADDYSTEWYHFLNNI